MHAVSCPKMLGCVLKPEWWVIVHVQEVLDVLCFMGRDIGFHAVDGIDFTWGDISGFWGEIFILRI